MEPKRTVTMEVGKVKKLWRNNRRGKGGEGNNIDEYYFNSGSLAEWFIFIFHYKVLWLILATPFHLLEYLSSSEVNGVTKVKVR